jgi:hypothetical protein
VISTTSPNNYYFCNMQMLKTRHTVYDTTEASGSAARNENRDPPLPPPPPYTTEQFFAQFLGSQRNMENMQQNMEAVLRSIADNTRRGVNLGGHEVN